MKNILKHATGTQMPEDGIKMSEIMQVLEEYTNSIEEFLGSFNKNPQNLTDAAYPNDGVPAANRAELLRHLNGLQPKELELKDSKARTMPKSIYDLWVSQMNTPQPEEPWSIYTNNGNMFSEAYGIEQSKIINPNPTNNAIRGRQVNKELLVPSHTSQEISPSYIEKGLEKLHNYLKKFSMLL